ncbi:multifunctional nucleoside diphosphate kinase/apyrimidinic endonuclease/3'-phosphodiesterase [Jimgerdemannia flammicorona]|uniref:Nucleoside diphosphate kinase n=1 Tax=Jimgerdemannia flammicorona TaxID=994334 RepID=A0A433DK74_9FUNG|nr:multifunctional nucleoside diphosphate kinase/apyrimidinic endonuclease/3'-phosphodiesterase [Jimgerdemannia flammicorona]
MAIERTLALIKPDAYPQHKDAVLARIREAGFTVVQEKEVHLTREVTERFYEEHRGRSFYEDLTVWISSKPIYALVLEKEDAVKEWRNLLGPTNSEKARAEAPETIRALFGTDGSKNAGHGSDSVASAEREILIIFG